MAASVQFISPSAGSTEAEQGMKTLTGERNEKRESASVSCDETSDSDCMSDSTLASSIGEFESKASASTTVVELKDWPYLIDFDQLPEWYKDNISIRTSYRPESFSYKICLESLKYLHNESVNIYTHLIPGIAFFFLEAVLGAWIKYQYPNAILGDYLAFAIFLLSATICFMCSASYHTFMCHSQPVNDFWLGLDFVGIIILTEGKFASGIWLVFGCESALRAIYWSLTSTLGAISVLVLLNKRFRGLKWRTFRTLCFIVTGMAGIAPLIHGLTIFGLNKMIDLGLLYYIGEGMLLLLGVFFYAKRIPESLKRFEPGSFDIWGSSHQIFHILVVAAVVVHLSGIISALHYNQESRTCIN